MAPIDEKLRYWQRELLDLSQRNRLFYFRPSRTSTVKLVEPDAAAIYRRLVLDERGLTFHSPDDEDAQAQLSLLFSEETAPQSGWSHQESEQQVQRPMKADEVRSDLTAPDLERVLYRIYQKARGSILE